VSFHCDPLWMIPLTTGRSSTRTKAILNVSDPSLCPLARPTRWAVPV
jgi:hypothetical protein